MVSDRRYGINEIFYSIQGEGMRAGTPNVFVRFQGCNLRCVRETNGFDCDTEFVSGRMMTAQEIAAEARLLIGDRKVARAGVIFTGGEPALQLDEPLLKEMALVTTGELCIETNGSLAIAPDVAAHLDWITVSPKVAEHAVRQLNASEVKYVRGYGQGLPRTAVDARHYLISPAFNGQDVDPRAMAWCVELVKGDPAGIWRLSIQQHKLMGIR